MHTLAYVLVSWDGDTLHISALALLLFVVLCGSLAR